jgi:hypothetical protein
VNADILDFIRDEPAKPQEPLRAATPVIA